MRARGQRKRSKKAGKLRGKEVKNQE